MASDQERMAVSWSAHRTLDDLRGTGLPGPVCQLPWLPEPIKSNARPSASRSVDFGFKQADNQVNGGQWDVCRVAAWLPRARRAAAPACAATIVLPVGPTSRRPAL